ncbi:MAG TPA: hypothetical protein VFT04_14985 [Gemmatimonadales bacterium]|nr:hypothetical protein [Gemmatimonadales bacterium]
MIARSPGLLLLLAAIAAPAAGQQSADAARLQERLDPATARLVSSVVDSATSLGLPSAPLVNKALEGASKGAAPDRILVAVRSLAADLRSARAALGPAASEAELVAGVGALRAGAEGDVLARVKRARGESSALLPLAVLSDLVAQGIPVDRAATVILGLAERRAADAQYRTLPRAHGRGGASAVGPAAPDPGSGRGNAGDRPGRGNAPDRPGTNPSGADHPAPDRPVDQPAPGRPVEPPAIGRPADPTRQPPVDGPGKGAVPELPPKGRPTGP